MKSTTVGALAALAMLAGPAFALAATYQYVDVNGNLKTITADSSMQALTLPADMAPHSGVMLIDEPSDMIPASTDVPL